MLHYKKLEVFKWPLLKINVITMFLLKLLDVKGLVSLKNDILIIGVVTEESLPIIPVEFLLSVSVSFVHDECFFFDILLLGFLQKLIFKISPSVFFSVNLNHFLIFSWLFIFPFNISIIFIFSSINESLDIWIYLLAIFLKLLFVKLKSIIWYFLIRFYTTKRITFISLQFY